MNEKTPASQRGQSLVLVAAAMVVLVGFVALAVDLGSAYYARRTAQNAADGAALAGVSEMATGINKHKPKLDAEVKAAMDEFADYNEIAFIDANGDGMHDGVDGYYVDGSGNRLSGDPRVGFQSGSDVPKDAAGVEAITYITATSFFGGIFGVRGYPIQARAVSLLKFACASDCVVPIVTSKETLFGPSGNQPKLYACYNIWSESYADLECDIDGDGTPEPSDFCPTNPGSYGWVSWTWQQAACKVETRPCPYPPQQGTGCSAETLAQNLEPDNCGNGFVAQNDWVANTTGIKNADEGIRCVLDYYLGIYRPECDVMDGYDEYSLNPSSFTIVVYDGTNIDKQDNPNPSACGGQTDYDDIYDSDAWGLHYHVAGFAQMQILGYELSQGGTNVSAVISNTEYLEGLEWLDPSILSDGFDPMEDCWNPPTAQQEGNRITAYFMDWVTSFSGSNECFDPWGTLRASPRLVE